MQALLVAPYLQLAIFERRPIAREKEKQAGRNRLKERESN
jgi:hypothetical protein